jgi:hypothetical protein
VTPGSVFFDEEFAFHDGKTGEKLFIVLGTVNNTSVVAKTTSRQHGRGTVFGCQNDRFYNFYIPDKASYIKGQTWVCLNEFYELNTRIALKKRFDGIIKPICTIEDKLLRLIQDCALNSFDISTVQSDIIKACLV